MNAYNNIINPVGQGAQHPLAGNNHNGNNNQPVAQGNPGLVVRPPRGADGRADPKRLNNYNIRQIMVRTAQQCTGSNYML